MAVMLAWWREAQRRLLWFYGSVVQRIGRAINSRTAAAIAMALPVIAYAIAAWGRRWMSDDGYIYLRVVDQVLAGNGPVFNHGERIEAATSPLWVGLLVLSKEIFRPISLPWLAVILGLVLSLAGLAFAQWGAYRLWQRGRPRAIMPLGAVVIAALPPFWDYATSGLETGLAFAWLGACFWGLASLPRADATFAPAGGVEDRAKALSLHAAAQPTFPVWLPIFVGLGPLVRPDFVLFVVAFIAALFLLRPRLAWRDRVRAGALMLALPVAYQVFRMGYYGALVPNPAFAKEASAANWPQGWHYLADTMQPYWLVVPLLLLVALALASWLSRRHEDREDAGRAVLTAAVVAAALAHGLYVVYVGGDFMHARLLLPALFALLLPVAVVDVHTAPRFLAALAVVAWAIVCAATLRPSYEGIGPHGIADERAYYVALAQHAHPITLDDYRRYPGAVLALIEREQLSRGSLVVESRVEHVKEIALRPGVQAEAVIDAASIGIFGYILGTNVHVVDLHGLADPIAGRLELTKRGRPGHEKLLPDGWVVARFADPAAQLPPSALDVAAARAALSCDGAVRLLAAVSEPMTPGRFARNFLDAFRLHRLRIPPDPAQAQAKLC